MRYFKTILAVTPLLVSPVACDNTMGPPEDHKLTVQGTIRSAEDGARLYWTEVTFGGLRRYCAGNSLNDWNCTGGSTITRTNRYGRYSRTVACRVWGEPLGGEVSMRVSKPGYSTAKREVKCFTGTLNVDVDLEPIP